MPNSGPCSQVGRVRRRICDVTSENVLALLSIQPRAAAYHGRNPIEARAWSVETRAFDFFSSSSTYI